MVTRTHPYVPTVPRLTTYQFTGIIKHKLDNALSLYYPILSRVKKYIKF